MASEVSCPVSHVDGGDDGDGCGGECGAPGDDDTELQWEK